MSAEIGHQNTSIKLIHVACGTVSRDDGRGSFEVGERKFLSVRLALFQIWRYILEDWTRTT